jgi:aminoglycoside phosphotransferase (APT) family kinase protein
MKLLTHEVDLMRTEVDFFRRALAVGAPVPAIVHADLDRDLNGRDFLFLELLAGESLASADPRLSTSDRAAVRRELGAAIGRLHAVTGDGYGPMPPAAIGERFARRAYLLDAVQRPALVHFDLWDGNVFIRQSGDGWRLTGLIDGERALYGDPYAEFVSIALFRDIRQLPEILDGYAEATGEPVVFTDEVRLRIAMYRCYLYLIMVTEGPTRGFDPVVHDRVRRRTLDLLAGLLELL